MSDVTTATAAGTVRPVAAFGHADIGAGLVYRTEPRPDAPIAEPGTRGWVEFWPHGSRQPSFVLVEAV